MIYLVTQQPELFNSEVYKIITLEDSLSRMGAWGVIQVDSETLGKDCHIDRDLCFQFGDPYKTTQIVVDTTTVQLRAYKEVLESSFLIFQNGVFDLKYLYNYGIFPRRIWDTMVVEQLIYLGFPNFMVGATTDIILEYCEFTDSYDGWEDLNQKQKSQVLEEFCPRVSDFIRNHSGVGLQALCDRYLGIYLSKEVRGQIIYKGLDPDVIVYAAGDVTHLYDIMQRQKARLEMMGLMKAAKVECDFVPVIAYFEWCGVHMNEELWKQKMATDKAKRDKALKELEDFVIKQGDERFFEQNLQGDLWKGFDTTPHCTINWNSTKQVIPFLTMLGFNCKGINKKTKEETDSIDSKVLEPQKDVNPEFYAIYEAFAEAQKVCSTYGQNYLNAINPVTNRLHTVFRQLGTDTGRLACGSQQTNESVAKLKKLPMSTKDSELKCCYPQLQNLPADEITRACFCAEDGNSWISVDYSGQESVLMADFSQDKAMLDVFLKGEDMHSTVAYMIFPDQIPRDTPIKDIKKKYKHLRQVAKGPEFCFAYGGNDSTLIQQYGMSPEQASSIYTNYMSGFSGISKFQEKQKRFVVNNGYILISPYTGHRATWWDWRYWKKVQEGYTKEFWEEYRAYHKGTGDSVARKVSRHFKAKTKWEKNACNSPLQGSGAIIFKKFSTQLFYWVLDEGLFNIVKFCIPVHDEINVECPTEIAQDVSNKIQEIMKREGTAFCKVLTLDSESVISDHWVH